MSEDTSADGVIAGTAECTHPRLAKIIGTIPRHLYVAKKNSINSAIDPKHNEQSSNQDVLHPHF